MTRTKASRRHTSRGRNTAPLSNPPGIDYYVVFFDVTSFAARCHMAVTTIARSLDIDIGQFGQWSRRGILPVSVFRALMLRYSASGPFYGDERELFVERVNASPFRIASLAVARLSAAWESHNPASVLQTSVLDKFAPKRQNSLIVSGQKNGPETSTRPIGSYIPWDTHGSATPQAAVRPAPQGVPSSVVTTNNHAGLRMLAEQLSAVRKERDTLKAQVADLLAQVDQYERSLSEALAMASEEQTHANQMAEAHAIVRSVDPTLADELETINRP